MPVNAIKLLWKRLRFQNQSRVLRTAKSLPSWAVRVQQAGIVLSGALLVLLIFTEGLNWHLSQPLFYARELTSLLLLTVFLIDAGLIWAHTVPKRSYVKQHFLDLLPLIGLMFSETGLYAAGGFIIFRYIVMLIRRFTDTARFARVLSNVRLNTAQIVVISFAATIGMGALLLTFPAATTDGQGANLTDAVFTATSATCVTGLIVQNTPDYFTPFGQVVILVLIQLGGLGIMTYSAFVALLFGRFSFGQRQMMQEMLDEDRNVYTMIFYIFRMTFLLELTGALLLFSRWSFAGMPPLQAAYHSVFHAVSAFCNAGFALYNDSLMGWDSDIVINITIMGLIILGGLGFMVVHDLGGYFARRQRLSPHSKLVLTTTGLLTLLGFLAIFFFEFDGQMAGLSFTGKFWTALFQSVTARTAGFNTLAIGNLSRITLTILIGLMFIGASPGSTGGGIKTSTFAVLLLSIKATLQGRAKVETYHRTIPQHSVQRALALTVTAGLLVVVGFILLMSWQSNSALALMFETVSAFGTVGLSTGITAELTEQSRWLVTLLMFLGRIGPLTLGIALAQSARKTNINYPDARIIIG